MENDKSYLTKPYDDTELKSEIATKITAPANPEVGKVFKIKSVNDDGTFIGEWADDASLDVQINGKSIVQDGVAEIPFASSSNFWGCKILVVFRNFNEYRRQNWLFSSNADFKIKHRWQT